MRRKILTTAAVLTLAGALPFRADAGTLRGSPSSMKKQHEIAVDEDLTFTEKASQVQHLVDSGELVAVQGNADFALSNVSFPYTRPEVLLFIERLSAQYHSDIGAKLVITSLTRPADLQPKNAHELSVHPAGMAVDFRIPSSAKARSWLEHALLGLENSRVLDVTREHIPPHYHVAVYPVEYLAYAEKKGPVKRAVAEVAMPLIEVGPFVQAVAASPQASAPSNGIMLIALSILTVTLGCIAPFGARRLRQIVRTDR